MNLLTTLERMFAASAFAERNDKETAILIAQGKEAARPRSARQTDRRVDKRPRLRV